MPFFISGAKSKNNLKGYIAFKGTPSQIFFFCNFMILKGGPSDLATKILQKY